MSNLPKLAGNRSEIFSYVFFGMLTTLVNYLVYLLCRHGLGPEHLIINTCIAWFVSVLFAYITNKIWVFKNNNFGIAYLIQELMSFIFSRLFTGVLDVVIMKICVDFVGFNDLATKIVSNIIVIVLNYLLSKKIVFRAR